MTKNNLSKAWPILLILKYLFSVLITLLAFRTSRDTGYLCMSLIELAALISISYFILSVNRPVGHVVHFAVLLFYNAQTLVLYFGGSFVTLNMLSNLVFLNDLHGKFLLYLRLVIPLAVLSLIPAKAELVKRKATAVLAACLLILEAAGLIWFGTSYSPMFGLRSLYIEEKAYRAMVKEIEDVAVDIRSYYNEEVEDYKEKPGVLTKSPNVVLIFVEGLSENIITDSRGIMPNFLDFEKEVLRFEQYYNHTFATLKGLIGQLYSGYQMDNFDTNSLCSMQSGFKGQGYQTVFINTEPLNAEFEGYLNNLGFDEVVTDAGLVDTDDSYISDKAAYDLLFDTISAQHADAAPFFTVIYTFGTHMSLDSPDEQYGDGSDPLLNRFYNQDYQFARFLERFRESPLFEDTILLVTTDHATYSDDDFLAAFPDYDRKSPGLDEIPFYIYHAGVEPGVIDADGRNSLDLAPTVMDYLDISVPNYFLGSSLFGPVAASMPCDTFYYDSSVALRTDGGEIQTLTESEYQGFRKLLVAYFRVKGDPDAFAVSEEYILAEVSADKQTMTVTLKSEQDYDQILFPVWSVVDGQDDLIWHEAAKNAEGEWSCTVELFQHSGWGIYCIHAYDTAEPDNLVAATWVNISDTP